MSGANEPGQASRLWKIWRLRLLPGRYWNSAPLERWVECGTVRALDEARSFVRDFDTLGPVEPFEFELLLEAAMA